MKQNKKYFQTEITGARHYNLLEFMSRFTLIILVLGGIISAAITPFALKYFKSYYEASASLNIEPSIQSVIGKEGKDTLFTRGRYYNYIRTQTILLKDRTVLKEAIERLPVAKQDAIFPEKMGINSYITILRNRLRIEPINNSQLVSLYLSGERQEGLSLLLSNIINVFLGQVEYEKKSEDTRRVNFLNDQFVKLKQGITEKENALNSLVNDSGTKNFSELFNIHFKKAEQLREASTAIYIKRIEAEKFYQQKLNDVKQISGLALTAYVEEIVAKDDGLDKTQAWTYERLQDLRAEIEGLASSNKKKFYIEKRMKSMQEYEKKMLKEIREQAKDTVYGKREYELKVELILAKSNLDHLLSVEKEIQQKLKEAEEQAAINSVRISQGDALREDLEQMRNRLFRLRNRMDDLKVESNVASRISLVIPAHTPDKRHINKKMLFLICLVMPFGVALTFCIVLYLIDTRIRTAKDVEVILGHSPGCTIPIGSKKISFSRISLDAPLSGAAKAVRSMAFRLHRDAELNQTKVFLFNGVRTQAGTTETMLNIAHALARMSNRVLVIEATFQPVLRAALQPPSSWPGLSEILTCRNTPEECIFFDEERSVDFIFSSEKYNVAAPIIQDILEKLRKTYDIILIDSAPVLDNDYAEYLAMYSDAVVLFVKRKKATFNELRQMAEIFVGLEVSAITSIFNFCKQEGRKQTKKSKARYEIAFDINNRLDEIDTDSKNLIKDIRN